MQALFLLSWENLWQLHLKETDVKPYGAGHQQIIVLSLYRSKRAVLPLLIIEELMQTPLITLNIGSLADYLDESRDHHRLCADVGVESILYRSALNDGVFRGGAGIQIAIDPAKLIEDELRLIAVDLPFLIVGLKCIGFYDEQGIVIESGNLPGFPCSLGFRFFLSAPAASQWRRTLPQNGQRPLIYGY